MALFSFLHDNNQFLFDFLLEICSPDEYYLVKDTKYVGEIKLYISLILIYQHITYKPVDSSKNRLLESKSCGEQIELVFFV
jgi:hypothetical protein